MLFSTSTFLILLPLITEICAIKCINGARTATINFDSVGGKNDEPVPALFEGFKFEGFFFSAKPSDSQFPWPSFEWTGYSRPNAGRVNHHGVITSGPLLKYGDLHLESFDATCFSYVSDEYVKPKDCSILVKGGNGNGNGDELFAEMYNYDIAVYAAPRFKHFTSSIRRRGRLCPGLMTKTVFRRCVHVLN